MKHTASNMHSCTTRHRDSCAERHAIQRQFFAQDVYIERRRLFLTGQLPQGRPSPKSMKQHLPPKTKNFVSPCLEFFNMYSLYSLYSLLLPSSAKYDDITWK
jgi:hypothetical protein